MAEQELPAEQELAAGQKHPPEYQQDLNPNMLAGQNWGLEGPHPEKDARTANEIKEFHNRFPELTNDDLKQIIVLPEGSRLEQGAVYIDLQNPEMGEFKATGDAEAGPNNWFVPKSEVDYQLWNRLIGVQNPERTGDADD